MLLVFPVVAARLTLLKAEQQRCASVDCLSSLCASFILQSCPSPFLFVCFLIQRDSQLRGHLPAPSTWWISMHLYLSTLPLKGTEMICNITEIGRYSGLNGAGFSFLLFWGGSFLIPFFCCCF